MKKSDFLRLSGNVFSENQEDQNVADIFLSFLNFFL